MGADLLWDGPDSADTVVILAPGAGAGSGHPFMETVAGGLAAASLRVCRFDFPYMRAGRRAPDQQPVLEAAYRDAVDEVRAIAAPRKLVLGGKSMGGRIASHVVAGGAPADGLVFLGYPLHPPGRPERLRAAHLEDIATPMLFVEGTRDPFCPLDTLESVRTSLQAPTEVAVIEDGDHSFKVRKASGRDTAAALTEAVDAVVDWVARL